MIEQGIKQIIEWIYGFSGDYGIAIVLLTVGIRLLMVPLSVQQRKQMKKQQELSVRMEELKKKYRKNLQKQNEELQKLYQENGIGGMGCLLSFLQFPIMLGLYQGIRLIEASGTTILLPWVSSLLLRDTTLLLPVATLVVQFLPQTYPYIRHFKALGLQKMSWKVILMMLGLNSTFVFVLPSGVGLYYFVSGLFTAVEQLLMNLYSAGRQRAQA